jgi:hypothetical protein
MYTNFANPLLEYWPLHSDALVAVLSTAGGLRSSCEVDDDVKNVVTADWLTVTVSV